MTALRTEDEGPRGFVPRSELYRALAKIDELEFEIESLKAKIGLVARTFVQIQAGVGCTPAEAKILSFLRNDRVVARAYIFDCLYGDDPGQPEIKIIDVYICKIRKAIRKAGGPADAIVTIWGQGHGLSQNGRQWLEERLASLSSAEPKTPVSGHPDAITGVSK